MCGIFGIINHSRQYITKGEAIVKQLFIASQFRGTDAYGMVLVNGKGEADWYKNAGVSLSKFFTEPEHGHPRFNKMETDKSFVIAHNRHATVGDKNNNDFAHPHVRDNIHLVHNGTLMFWEGKYAKENEGESDSQGATRLVKAYGIEAAVKKIRGAYVFVFYDEETKKLNIIRNHERPLGIVHTKHFSVFASEPRMAEWILDRNDVGILHTELIKVGHLYQWGIGEQVPTVKEIDIKQEIPSYSKRYNDSDLSDWEADERGILTRANRRRALHPPPTNNTHQQTQTKLLPNKEADPRKPKIIVGTKGTVRSYEGYELSDEIEFHIDTYERKGASNFCSFTGRIFGDPNRVAQVTGNVALPISELDTNKFLFKGKITSMSYRHEFIQIHVGNVTVSTTEDPDRVIKIEEEEEQTGGKVVALPAPPFRGVPEWSGRIVECDQCGAKVPEETVEAISDLEWDQTKSEWKSVTKHVCKACLMAFEARVCH